MTQHASSPTRPLLVTAALIRDGSKILIAQRKSDAPVEPLKWEFPGGKVEYGEHPEACLIREIREELNLEIEIEDLFDIASHIYSLPKGDLHIILLCYKARAVGGELKRLDVQDALWIEPSRMGDYEYAAADVPVVQKYMRLQCLAQGS